MRLKNLNWQIIHNLRYYFTVQFVGFISVYACWKLSDYWWWTHRCGSWVGVIRLRVPLANRIPHVGVLHFFTNSLYDQRDSHTRHLSRWRRTPRNERVTRNNYFNFNFDRTTREWSRHTYVTIKILRFAVILYYY